jgi:hypothetical protein
VAVDRRTFLGGTLAAGVALAGRWARRFAQPNARVRITT